MQDGYRILGSGKSGKMAKIYQHHKFPPCLGYPKHEGKDEENLTHFFGHYRVLGYHLGFLGGLFVWCELFLLDWAERRSNKILLSIFLRVQKKSAQAGELGAMGESRLQMVQLT